MSRKIEFRNHSRINDSGLAKDKEHSQDLVVDSSAGEAPRTPYGKVSPLLPSALVNLQMARKSNNRRQSAFYWAWKGLDLSL